MDNLTHTLTGLMLSRAALDRVTPRSAALLMLAANAPDLDAVAALAAGDSYLDWHRGATHSLLFVPLVAVLPVLLVGLIRRRDGFPWLRAWIVSIVGVLSHLLLDYTNIYGIRLLWPVSREWYRMDLTNLVDPWIWMLMLLGVVWPWLARLVSSEIGARSRAGAGIARFVLAALLSYEFARWVLHARALATLEARLYAGRPPRMAAALPHFANPLRWRGLIETADSWRVIPLDLLGDFDPTAGRVLYKQTAPTPALEKARDEPAFQSLERFSRTLYWRESPAADPGGGVEVAAVDLRFSLPEEGGFTARALVVGGRVIESGFRFRPRR